MCIAKVLQSSDFPVCVCVIADLLAALVRCFHRVWLLILMGFMALLAVPSTPVPDDWWAAPSASEPLSAHSACCRKSYEVYRSWTSLKLLLISHWLSFRNVAAIPGGCFREEVEMRFQCPSTVMLECDPSTHVIRFGIFSYHWQAKRELAIFLCSLFVLRWFSKACFSCWQQRDSLHGYYGGWLLSVNSSFFFFVVVVVIG